MGHGVPLARNGQVSLKFSPLGTSGTTPSQDVIDRDRTCAEKDEREGDDRDRQGKFESVIAGEAVVPVNFPDGNDHVDADGGGRGAGEKSGENQQSAEKLCEGRQIAGPDGKTQAGHKVGMVMESAEYFVGAMNNHHRSQSQPHTQQSEGLQTIEVAHEVPPAGTNRLSQEHYERLVRADSSLPNSTVQDTTRGIW